MMNAGVSPAGRNFAIRNSDLHFDDLHFSKSGHPESASDRIKETKRLARELGREIQVWIPVSIVCRPSQKEVDDYLRRCVEHADWEASGKPDAPVCRAFQRACSRDRSPAPKNPVDRKVLGYGENYAIFGEPDHVARELHRLHEAGFDGVAIDFINYLEELPYFVQEVIPRLERMGIRRPASSRLVAS